MPLSTLNKYLPPNALSYITEWLGTHKIDIHIKRDRKSKLGDYCKQANAKVLTQVNTHLFFQDFLSVILNTSKEIICQDLETLNLG